MNKLYEYKVVGTSYGLNEDELNTFGYEGWKLVNVVYVPYNTEIMVSGELKYYFIKQL